MYARLPAIDRDLEDAGLQQGNWPRFSGVDATTANALATFVGAVEPVKKYTRGGFQPDHVQSTPLNQLADWARPESTSARLFNETYLAWTAQGSSPSDSRVDVMEKQLHGWQDAGKRAAAYFSGADEASAAQRRTALALAAISNVGLDCLRAARDGKKLSREAAQPAEAILRQAATPNYSAVEFPFLSSLRALLASVTAPNQAAADATMR